MITLKMTKKKIPIILILSVLPVVAFATKPVQCSLNSTCSFELRGKFNLKIKTPELKAGTIYQCQMNNKSVGRLLSIRNIKASSGVRYLLKGDRFNKPFIIHGPKSGVGHIVYTIYNNNDFWSTNTVHFICKPITQSKLKSETENQNEMTKY